MTMPRLPSDYRADIDGLRAIAVLAVMIFHGRDTALPGGFVGVDIFFVISGYLISKHIATEAVQGRVSLAEFYRRRIRRIVPMMMTVVGVTLLVSLFIMTPDDVRAVAKSAVWSIASMANIHFWRDVDSGYFARSSSEIPLLHLWSLGVEEQFYFVWPLLLALGIRRMRAPILLGAMTLLALASFQLASVVFVRDPSAAYYLLPTRAGELLLGALAGVAAALTSWRLPGRVAIAAGWLGAMLIGASLWALDRHDAFPGWLALPPTLGAALVILAGDHGRPLPGLAARPLVFVGTLSYSAYLWHWPLFALYRYGYGEPGAMACVAILALTLLLAWLSFEFIERPTRRSTAPLRVVALRQFAVPAVVLLLPAVVIAYSQRLGVPLASAGYLKQLASLQETTRPAFTFDWVCQRQRLTPADLSNPRCIGGAPGGTEPHVLLWGDSNAAHYVPMLNQIAARAGVRFRNLEVSACPPLFTDPRPYVDARRLGDCRASTDLLRDEIARYPVVMISAAWSTYLARSPGFIDDVGAAVRTLAERGQSVVLIGRAPVLADYDPHCKERALRVPLKRCPDRAEPLADEVVQVNERLLALAESTPNVRYFDGNHYLCRDGVCPRQDADGLPRYLDSTHLTVSGSTELGQQVLQAEGVPAAFEALKP